MRRGNYAPLVLNEVTARIYRGVQDQALTGGPRKRTTDLQYPSTETTLPALVMRWMVRALNAISVGS